MRRVKAPWWVFLLGAVIFAAGAESWGLLGRLVLYPRDAASRFEVAGTFAFIVLTFGVVWFFIQAAGPRCPRCRTKVDLDRLTGRDPAKISPFEHPDLPEHLRCGKCGHEWDIAKSSDRVP